MGQRHSLDLARLFLMFVLILMLIGLVAQPASPVQASGNGQFEIAVWLNNTWQVAGSLSFDQMYSQQQIDLSSFTLPNPVQIRVTDLGTTAAQIDTVTQGGQLPTAVQGATESPTLVAKKLAQRDYDVIDASGKSFVFTFPVIGSSSVLALVARIEPAINVGVPFQYPVGNIAGAVDSTSQFYSYPLNSVPGALNVDGDLNDEKLGEPFFKEWSQPTSGHPANFTYGWVLNDTNYLYVALDFMPDNTYDGDKDFTAVFVKTANGVQRFKVSVPEQQWGKPGFEYTARAVYQHKVYEYKLPLAQIGFSAARDGTVELAFEAYGTSSLVTLVSSMNPSTFGQNVTFTATANGGPIQFFDGSVTIPGCSAVPLDNFKATCSISTLSIGNHIISASPDGALFFMIGNPQVVLAPASSKPAEVPEADTLLLLGGGIGGLATWVGWQFRKRRGKQE